MVRVHVDANPIRAVDGRQAGAAVVGRDIMGQKHMEQHLRDSEDHLRRVIEAMHVFVGVLTPDGIMVECNAAPIQAAGLRREDVIGVHFGNTFWWGHSEESRARIRSDITRAAAGESVRYDAPVRVRAPDGTATLIDVDFALTPLRDGKGRVTHLIPIGIDISARTRAEAALRDADRQKDEFIAVLAHELRNPLAPVRAAIGALRAHHVDDPVVVRCHEIIDRQVSHMARLLDDLLDVTRLAHGTLVLRRRHVRLSAVLDAAVEMVRPLVDGRRQTLVVDAIDPSITIDGDDTRLSQVFGNLLSNAARYTPDEGRIQVSGSLEGERVTVVVQDNGVGIDPTMRQRIFDPFNQQGDARDRRDDSLGIGLALTKRLVELHGGHIAVSSDGLGRGSSFSVTLSAFVEPSQPEDGAATVPPATTAQVQRVLVVDDNTDAADTLAMLIEALGCDVRTAYDGEVALKTADVFHPELVLLDLGMPGLNGQSVCQRLREGTSGAGVVIAAVTGWGQDEDRRRTRAAGFNHHLVKPVDPEVLARLVRNPRVPPAPAGIA